jgi:uncharacterized protein YndB with AHSA1/START domain
VQQTEIAVLKTVGLIALAFILLIGGLVAYASTQPDTFRVQRTLDIKATPEALFPMIADLRQFNRWNPFALKDVKGTGQFSGPTSGPGAAYDFEGGSSGSGRITITDVTPPRRVAMSLIMTKPLAADHAITFSLQPAGDMTTVTWAMEGKTPLLGKVVHLFMSMDTMIGREFASGLAGLKALAEQK